MGKPSGYTDVQWDRAFEREKAGERRCDLAVELGGVDRHEERDGDFRALERLFKEVERRFAAQGWDVLRAPHEA